MRVAGFLKVRNEIIREGNLFRVLSQLEQLCDGGVICDDASTDGTREHLRHWVADRQGWHLLLVNPAEQDFQREMEVKQRMMALLHQRCAADWILWMDGDELFDRGGVAGFRRWLEVDGGSADVWAFHYTQVWRSICWARIDSGFDLGWFWKLWRYTPDLSFASDGVLHRAQFPVQYVARAVFAAENGGSRGRAKRAPFEVIHLGNYGKNLLFKAVQYRDSGPLAGASLTRHLYFGQKNERCHFRHVNLAALPAELDDITPELPEEHEPMPYTKDEIKLIERLGTLRQTEGLFVVIVPTFNRGYCLDRTLGSVLAQTDSHWICIVLDDGSTDNTVEIMRRWQDSDPRFFACHYQENRGGVAMNEIGMTLACEFGEFWTRLGSDDYFEPHKIALDRLAFDTGADAVYGPYRDLHETHLGEEVRNPPCDARGLLLSRGFAASWANIAVRVSALAAVRARHGNFVDSSIRNMEDWLLNTRLAYQFEFVWRGLRKRPGEAGQVVIGARDWAQVPGGPAEIVIDAVWRIGADGASQKPDICNLDARRTVDVLDDDAERFQPAPRAPVIAIGFQPWRGRDPGPSVALKPRLYPGGPPPTLPAPPEPEEAGFSLSTQGKTAPASAFSLATRRK